MKLPETPLGTERKRLALVVILVGLATFLLPMVILNPPLQGRAQWWPLHIAEAVYVGELPVRGGHFDEVLVEMALIYVLLVVSLGALLLRSPKPLTIISTVGLAVSVTGKFWRHGLLYTFGWDYWQPGRMKIGVAWWILPWVMPALLSLCFAKSLDVEGPERENVDAVSRM